MIKGLLDAGEGDGDGGFLALDSLNVTDSAGLYAACSARLAAQYDLIS